MNWLKPALILVTALLAVFVEATFEAPRRMFGAQIDLLPALIVYASLSTSLLTMTTLAIVGGLLFDSLSFNPLGITIFPLFLAGFLIYPIRTLIMREQAYARFVLGLGASAFVPAMTLLLLLNTSKVPSLGWGTLWQWIVMTVGGGLLTPVVFLVLNGLHRALTYRPATQTSFRPDREIRRGRN